MICSPTGLDCCSWTHFLFFSPMSPWLPACHLTDCHLIMLSWNQQSQLSLANVDTRALRRKLVLGEA